jgi:putative ABC transport system permease protein
MVDAGYFATMRIPLRSGSAFTAADVPGSEPVTIINQVLADELWPGQDPIGRMMLAGDTPRRVIGVVGAVRYFSLDRDVEREMYFPIGHSGGYNSVDLVVRGSNSSTATLIAGVRAALRRADPNLPVAHFRTMQELVDRSVLARRFVVMLVAGFAMFAVVLSALGVYAVISYSVSQRTHEIGIRMAIGARPLDVFKMILGHGMKLALIGVVLGLAGAFALTRLMATMLFGVAPTDVMTFGGISVLLITVALLACYLPGRRATKVEPTISLRYE